MANKLFGAAAVTAAASLLLTSCGRTVDKASTGWQNGETMPSEAAAYSENDGTADASEQKAPERLDIALNMPEGYNIQKRCKLDLKPVMQEPLLPTGCEVTALAQTLNYCGFNIDNAALSDYFLPQDFDGWFTMDEYYLGDPRTENGFGCNAPVLIRTASDYFDYLKSDWYPADLSGTPFENLLYQIEQGRPVIVWVTMQLREAESVYQFDLGCGEEFWFNDYHHCITICGYDLDKGIVWTADPLEGSISYPIERFETVYDIMGKQAIVLVGNEGSAGVDYSDSEYKKKWMRDRHPSWFGEEPPEDGEFEFYYEFDNPVDFTSGDAAESVGADSISVEIMQ